MGKLIPHVGIQWGQIYGFSSKMSVDLLLEWSTNPVIVTLDSLNYPTDHIPFPTITICDKENQPSMVSLVAKIMNHVDYLCFDDDNKR